MNTHIITRAVRLPVGLTHPFSVRWTLHAIVIAALVGFLIFAAIRAAAASDFRPLASTQGTLNGDDAANVPVTVTIYCIENGPHGARLAASSVQIPPGRRPIAYAINAMASMPNSPLPPGTLVRSVVVDADGIATVDFNSALIEQFSGSTADESRLVRSLCLVAGQFPGVKQLRVLVDGRSIASIGGHVDLTNPIDVVAPQAKRSFHRQPYFHHRWRISPPEQPDYNGLYSM